MMAACFRHFVIDCCLAAPVSRADNWIPRAANAPTCGTQDLAWDGQGQEEWAARCHPSAADLGICERMELRLDPLLDFPCNADGDCGARR
jgi:hypothetical protein